MKGSEIGRGTLAAIVSLAMMLGMTACSRDYVIAYVYATTAKPAVAGSTNGAVSGYEVDFQSGALTQLADSPIPAGKNPVTLVALDRSNDQTSTENGEIYVVNRDDSTISPYAIGTDGKLYPAQVVNLTGSLGSGAAVSQIDATHAFLYVTFTYQLGPGGQQLYSPASPGPGGVTIFPVKADNSLGTGSTVLVGNNPVAVATGPIFCVTPVAGVANSNQACTLPGGGAGVLTFHYVYVVDQENSPNATVLGFVQNPTTGALTPVPGTTIRTVAGKTVATGFRAGIVPNSITVDPTGHFVYVTDQAANQIIGYVIQGDGSLVPMVDSPFPAGLFPVGITIDPRGKHLYAVNFNANTISQYEIGLGGNLTGGTGLGGTAVPTGPTCVAIEPALGVYLYTSNNLDGTVSGEQLDPHNGALQQIQNTPFPASGLPTCVVAVANGSHPSALVSP